MSAPKSEPVVSRAGRVASVDALRGLTIAVMVLVNDAEEAASAPWLLKHMPPGQQGITIADVVVPAFTLVVGMSIPLALAAAKRRGDPLAVTLRRILWRTLGLLTMGLFMVGRQQNTWHPQVWMGLMYLAFIGTWSELPKAPGLKRTALLAGRVLGLGALAFLAYTYRSESGEYLVFGPLRDPPGTVWLLHRWWDILGLLGFAYLVTSLVYLAIGPRRLALAGVMAGMVSLYALVERTALLKLDGPSYGALLDAPLAVLRWVNVHADLGHVLGIPSAMALAGCILGTFLVDGKPATRFASLFAGTLALGAVALAPAFGVTKHASTPAWALGSCAITVAIWVLLERVGEPLVARLRPLEPAAQNALLVYFLHPLVRGAISVIPGVSLLGLYKQPVAPPAVATVGAVAMTAFVVWLAGRLTRLGLVVRV